MRVKDLVYALPVAVALAAGVGSWYASQPTTPVPVVSVPVSSNGTVTHDRCAS